MLRFVLCLSFVRSLSVFLHFCADISPCLYVLCVSRSFFSFSFCIAFHLLVVLIELYLSLSLSLSSSLFLSLVFFRVVFLFGCSVMRLLLFVLLFCLCRIKSINNVVGAGGRG